MSSTLQNLLVALGMILIAALGYYLYTQNSASKLSHNVQVTSEASLAAAGFLQKLQVLKGVQLDDRIFSDQRFQNLVSYSAPVQPSYTGTSNPFVSGR